MFQQITIIGNLGNDPKFSYTPTGLEVCSFSLATNRKHKDGSDDKLWFSVSVFGVQAKPCSEYLRKGSLVHVIGGLKGNENGNPHTYTKSDGSIGSTFNITARQVNFLDNRGADEESEEVSW